MKKTALLLLVLLLALGILLTSCGKKEDEDKPPEDGTQDNGAQIDSGDIPEPAEPVELTVATVLADAVNVRQTANSQSTSLGKVNRGDMLQVQTAAEDTATDWYRVQYQGQSGYIHKDFLVLETLSSDTGIEIGTVVNVESVLNIRSAPNTESNRLGKAQLGEKFRVLERNAGDGWTKIQYQGTESSATAGYVKTEYLHIEQTTVQDALL